MRPGTSARPRGVEAVRAQDGFADVGGSAMRSSPTRPPPAPRRRRRARRGARRARTRAAKQPAEAATATSDAQVLRFQVFTDWDQIPVEAGEKIEVAKCRRSKGDRGHARRARAHGRARAQGRRRPTRRSRRARATRRRSREELPRGHESAEDAPGTRRCVRSSTSSQEGPCPRTTRSRRPSSRKDDVAGKLRSRSFDRGATSAARI